MWPTTGLFPLVGLPIPPHLVTVLGHPGDARCVAFYWVGQKFLWDDGYRCMTGADWHAWRQYTKHPRVAKCLAPFCWYDEDGEGADGLALDRELRIAYVGPVAVIREYLRRQYQPAEHQEPLVVDEAQLAALTARLIQAHAEFGSERAGHATEQVKRLQALRDWLDDGRLR